MPGAAAEIGAAVETLPIGAVGAAVVEHMKVQTSLPWRKQ
jgi:hypothetical protein